MFPFNNSNHCRTPLDYALDSQLSGVNCTATIDFILSHAKEWNPPLAQPRGTAQGILDLIRAMYRKQLTEGQPVPPLVYDLVRVLEQNKAVWRGKYELPSPQRQTS